MGRVKRLRTSHSLNRFFHILTFTLAADLLLGFSSVALYHLFGWQTGLPRFFEMLLVILIVREVSRLKIEPFSMYLDRRFALKDRIYSLLWYLVPGNAPGDIVDAHARDCLYSIDFKEMDKGLRPKIPLLLPLVLILFAATLYLSWNSEYRPPGITNRIVLNQISPLEKSDQKGSGESGEQLEETVDPPGSEAEIEGSDGLSREIEDSNEKEEIENTNRHGIENDLPGPVEGIFSPGGSVVGGKEGTGEARKVDLVAPDTVDSITVTDEVSAPVPSRLDPISDEGFETLPEAREFLSLVPGQGGNGAAALDQSVIENFRSLIKDHPPVYREQLETYYRELLKWEEIR